MNILRGQVSVDKYNFELVAGEPSLTTNVEVKINEVVPSDEADKNILENGKIFRIEVPFALELDRFKIEGLISQIAQIEEFFGQPNELEVDTMRELSKPLIEYIERLTYEVTEIAFDEPGVTLNFESN
ncbi:DUF1149 family protein [Carnobacterium divergens]|uniref:DUF1149 family protein n=1 Tax=Carnobacterium divergens TaxID=2748 RepID=UPI00128C8BA4|nr:DUF1149 family protein [Carnobacterium divergens]MPQ22213.1 DUF1149 family protein [Carnobacterium divergens]